MILGDEVARRRTFAIISHPDAGKTTLTEKLLLFGGAIQLAGTVKGRKAARHATSDWMRLEQQRGISVTSSVMQFPYSDCIVNLVYALGADYRANGTFIMNSKTAGAVRKMKDADGSFMWGDSLQAGEPARLMGYPVLICEDMPDVAANSHPIAFGDFTAGYTIAERPDLRILRDPFSAKPNVLFYANKRVGGDVTDFAAIKLLRVAVS